MSSTCIRTGKDSPVKLQIEVINGRLRKSVEALVRGKGLPCLQIRVGSVTKALQPPLDVFSRNAEFVSLVGRTPWYRTMCCFCFTVHWHRIDFTFVGSSPSADTCGATWTSSLSSCVWPLLSSGRFYRVSP